MRTVAPSAKEQRLSKQLKPQGYLSPECSNKET